LSFSQNAGKWHSESTKFQISLGEHALKPPSLVGANHSCKILDPPLIYFFFSMSLIFIHQIIITFIYVNSMYWSDYFIEGHRVISCISTVKAYPIKIKSLLLLLLLLLLFLFHYFSFLWYCPDNNIRAVFRWVLNFAIPLHHWPKSLRSHVR